MQEGKIRASVTSTLWNLHRDCGGKPGGEIDIKEAYLILAKLSSLA
jgi:hypothetical protein